MLEVADEDEGFFLGDGDPPNACWCSAGTSGKFVELVEGVADEGVAVAEVVVEERPGGRAGGDGFEPEGEFGGVRRRRD